MQWLRWWYVCVGCVAHDFNGGARHAVLQSMQDKELLKRSFLTMESCRKGYKFMPEHLGPWLHIVAQFTDTPFSCARGVYGCLGAKGPELEKFVDLEVRFNGQHLLIASRHRENPDLFDTLIVLYLHVWAFRAWTATRFCQFQKGGEQLSFSMLLGLEALVDYALKKGASSYYLGGVTRNINAKVKDLALEACIACKPCSKALSMIMEDDRLPLQLPALDKVLSDELQAIHDITANAWDALAKIVDCEPGTLRDRCCQGSLTSVAYINYRLRIARKDVWKLIQGDRRANVLEFAVGPQPKQRDSVLFKIHELVRLGEIETVLDGLELLSKASWTTLPEEQQNRIHSGLMKVHKTMEAPLLQSRAFGHPATAVVDGIATR